MVRNTKISITFTFVDHVNKLVHLPRSTHYDREKLKRNINYKSYKHFSHIADIEMINIPSI
ncbi:hypothetical protein Sjap_002423 [Stephania japonica]|uniref:Uncharacterized protein n=1 Tax=Stephania japonica TaxID=461633 RepID=A0AAP0PSI4_9MAGN